MTLQVPFDQFAKTVLRLLETKEAYVSAHGTGSVVTAASATKVILVMTRSALTPEEAKTKLAKAGLEVFEGTWSDSDELQTEEDCPVEAFIVAVAYKSSESIPGVWIDAFPIRPTSVQAIRALYDEFRETGELGEVSFEEFVRLGEPNVAIVSPTEIQRYLEKKADCP